MAVSMSVVHYILETVSTTRCFQAKGETRVFPFALAYCLDLFHKEPPLDTLKRAQGEESGDSPQANQLVVCTGYMSSHKDNPSTSEINSDATSVFVASYLVCDVTSSERPKAETLEALLVGESFLNWLLL